MIQFNIFPMNNLLQILKKKSKISLLNIPEMDFEM
jgi:hypothetical protein